MSLLKNKFFAKLSFVTMCQCVSLLSSALMLFLLPKVMSVSDYGYWQMFLLYSGYVGLAHFGYSDGLYIRLGGRKLEQLHKFNVSRQFSVFCIFQLLLSLVVFILTINFVSGYNQTILIYISIYLFIENIYKLLSFILIATDNAIDYSKSVLLDKILLILILLVFVSLPKNNYILIIVLFLMCRLTALVYLYTKVKPYFSSNLLYNYKQTVVQIIRLCSKGIILMLANLVGTLIVSSGRFLIERFWDIEIFANISLALSLSSFVLVIISQVSLILFPFICNADSEKQAVVLTMGDNLLSFMTMLGFGAYFLIFYVVESWLPSYYHSIDYLVYLFPIVLFEAKISVIYTTFYKALEKLKLLLYINLFVLLLSVSLYAFAILCKSIVLVMLTMIITQIIRSLIMQFFLYRSFKLGFNKRVIIEIVYVILFISIYLIGGNQYLLIFYLLASILLVCIYKSQLKLLKNKV